MGSVTAIDIVPVVVDDQEKALEFYVDLVGLELRQDEEYGDGTRWIEVAPARSKTKLTLKTPSMFEKAEAVHRRALMGSSPQVTFLVDDCRQIYQRLQNAGVPFDDEPTQRAWGTSVTARDPAGNLVVFTESD